ncbi:MAG: VOC family protein [Gemmatimonadales bacterium]
MPRPVHFEIHAEQPTRAIAFYEALFGWTFTSWGGGGMQYWLVTTGPDGEPGINGGLIQRQGTVDGTAVIAYVCTIGVTNVDDTLARGLTLGATVALPKMPIPGVGWLAYLKDTEGNIFGITHSDTDAR